MPPRTRDLTLAALVALTTQLTCALLLGGRVHPDETHQYLEVAHRYVWHYGTRPHEWYAGMRNLVAPGVLTGLFALLHRLHIDDPRVYLSVTHALLGALSLSALAAVYDVAIARTDERPRALFVTLVLALWVPWQNLAFRTLGETFSALALLAALRAWERTPRSDFTVGLWLGLGFVLRYPAGVFFVPFACAYVLCRDHRALARWACGIALVLLALGVIDQLTWGRPWHSVLAYADYNLLRDRARIDYGARPGWFYLACVLGLAPVAHLATAWRSTALRRAGMPLAVSLVYIAVMSLLAHKETRFFLPVIPPLVLAAGLLAPTLNPRAARIVLALCALHSAASLVVYRFTNVCEGDATLAAEWIGRQPSVGAVALVGVSHPGYAHLHRDVPVHGHPRNDVAASLAALGSTWPRPPGAPFYAIVRSDTAVTTLRSRGWRFAHREGSVAVLALAAPPRLH